MRALLGAVLAVSACSGSCVPKAQLRGHPLEGPLTAPAGSATFDHSAWAEVLAASVDQGAGRVDYSAVDPPTLERYTTSLATADLRSLDTGARRALLINAYNAFTVQLIVEQPERPASIRDLPEPWKSTRWRLAGESVSLDDIEHGLLRPLTRDPRLHFALNCASIGCPPLRAAPYQGPGLDRQLDAATRDALAMERHLKVDGSGLKVTRLLDWYGDDFTAQGWAPRADSIPEWLAVYAPRDVQDIIKAGGADTRLRFLDHNWALNDVSR